MNDSVVQLIERKVIAVGKKAKSNPEFSQLSDFALGIANKDYAAQTPFLWNSVYEELGMSQRNIRTYGNPADAAEILAALRNDPHYIGGDVGVGFKDRVLDLLDRVDPSAKLMGAVNVLTRDSNGLTGYNTDGEGYAQSLKTILGQDLTGKKVVLLGAGGTGNAIAVALAGYGARVVILNRTVSKAQDLAGRINDFFGKELAQGHGRESILGHVMDADAIVAAIDDQDSPLDQYSALATITLPATADNIAANLAEATEILAKLRKDTVISDVMLRSQDTATIATAKKTGFRTLDGYPMVLNQAIEAFWLVNKSELSQVGVDKPRVEQIMRRVASGSAN